MLRDLRRLAIALVVLVAPVAALPATAAHAAGEIGLSVEADPAFSPNGDGRHDRAAIRFRVQERATVRIAIGDDRGVTMASARFDDVAPGWHRWTWDGRFMGERLTDDSYFYSVRASSGTTRGYASGHIAIDTVDGGHLVTSRRTVYPRATVVDDGVWVQFVPQGWDRRAHLPRTDARFRVLDQHGRIVWQQKRRAAAPAMVWHGDIEAGGHAAHGRYVVEVRHQDEVGNRSTRRVIVRVSSQQLREVVETRTLPASEWATYVPRQCACADALPPGASDRFPGGLSFRAAGPDVVITRADFAAHLVDDPAYADSYRVTVAGGPTTPGAPDTAIFFATGGLVTPQGDGSTATRWARVALGGPRASPDLDRPVIWTFATRDPSSYDVASFTVEYRHYVPAG